MIGLPPMANQDGIQKYKQTKFGGYNHTLGADNGDIWDMKNMTSDFYPLLGTQAPALEGTHTHKTERVLRARRAVLGGRNGVLRRRNAQGNCHEREKEVCESGCVHHHPAGQEVL